MISQILETSLLIYLVFRNNYAIQFIVKVPLFKRSPVSQVHLDAVP